MRKSAVALALVLVAMLLGMVPGVAAADAPKVVIVVGATEGTTDSYRRDADQIYATAVQYTPNVVKVYSPDATWSAVKSAVAGAAIVIYLGHGNGWPSPYAYDPNYTTKDGFGLNKVAGGGDSNRVYYGEPYIQTLALNGAVVILNHLCYASGNSESGAPEPSISVAQQRVDNYASAFLRAGAAAVIADAHNGLDGYLRDLFTTSQPIDQLWANQGNANGNIVSFASARTPGATAYQDPNTPTSGFYRSLVVRSAGTIVALGSSGAPVVPPPPPTPVAPQLTQLSPGPESVATISPNGDGFADALSLTATTSAPGSIGVSVRDPLGSTVRSWSVPVGDGPAPISWDGRDSTGATVADGRYQLSVVPIDAVGNVGAGQDRTVDVMAALGWVQATTPAFFAATGSAIRPATLSFALSRPMTVTWTVLDAENRVVATSLNGASLPAGTQTWSFDGRADDGSLLPPGRYSSTVLATDGSLTMTQSSSFVADAFLLRPSTTTPKRGKTLTVTLTSAVPLGSNPRVSIYQPGLAAWSVGTVRLSATTYRATIRLKAGHSGTVTFKAKGLDTDGVLQQISRSYHLS